MKPKSAVIYILVVIVGITLAILTQDSKQQDPQIIPPKEDLTQSLKALEYKEGDTLWIDVRSPGEYQGGHFPNAINVPVSRVKETFQVLVPNKEAIVGLYCHSGNRSGTALSITKELGYSKTFNAGGYLDLIK